MASEAVSRPRRGSDDAPKGWTLANMKHKVFSGWARFSKSYRRGLGWCLEQVAYLGIDLDLQMDALRDDFVTSKTFRVYVEKVFDECDVDGTGKLDGGEFYAAVLLLYHHLNRIPFSRKKFPPERAVVMRLFKEYYEQQEQVLALIEKKGLLLADLDKRASLRLQAKDSRLSKVAPRVIRESAFSVLFFVIYLSVYNLWLCRNCEPVMSMYLHAAAGAISLGLGLFLFNGTEIMIDELPATTVFSRGGKEKKKGKKEEKRRRSVGPPEVDKVTFLAMCQDHFTDVLASETWRILSVAVILPFFAYQLKKMLFSVKVINDLFHAQRLFPEEAVIPTFVSLVLLIFPFIDSYVEKNVLWHDFAQGNHRSYFKKTHRPKLLDPERWQVTKEAVTNGRDSLTRKNRKKLKREKRRERRQTTHEYIMKLTSDAEEEEKAGDIETVHVEGQRMYASDTEVETEKELAKKEADGEKQEPEGESTLGFLPKKAYFSDDEDPVEILSDSGGSITSIEKEKEKEKVKKEVVEVNVEPSEEKDKGKIKEKQIEKEKVVEPSETQAKKEL